MTKSRWVGIALALLLVLSGCTGNSATTTEGPPDIAENGTVPAAADLQAATLSAMSGVDGYTANQTTTIVRQTDDRNRTTTVSVSYAVNRSERALISNRSTTGPDGTVNVTRYLVEETLYQHSETFTEEYGTTWISRDLSENPTRYWQLSDQLWRYQFTLGNATLSNVTTATVDGVETYVVTADVDTEELNTALRESLDLPPGISLASEGNVSLTARFWIDSETYRPVQVERTLEETRTNDGTTVQVTRDVTTKVTYGNVSVSLPDAAEDAQSVGDQ
ncbi:hypothetical protein [Halorhabdus sp. CUG00001]|uniref:hypothetical protein n=1 Tax=Halorhabdus sp. CUG00001 TaxID=2600297 RepID=UPI00131CE0C4|nr:hypothetical protein [Halorhabdus sp. CUG00001]